MKNPRVVNIVNQEQYHLFGDWTKDKFELLKSEADNEVIVITNSGYHKATKIRALRWAEED